MFISNATTTELPPDWAKLIDGKKIPEIRKKLFVQARHDVLLQNTTFLDQHTGAVVAHLQEMNAMVPDSFSEDFNKTLKSLEKVHSSIS